MSEWYEAEEKDIDIDFDDEEVSFFVKSDDNGNIYLTLSFEQILELAKQIKVNA